MPCAGSQTAAGRDPGCRVCARRAGHAERSTGCRRGRGWPGAYQSLVHPTRCRPCRTAPWPLARRSPLGRSCRSRGRAATEGRRATSSPDPRSAARARRPTYRSRRRGRRGRPVPIEPRLAAPCRPMPRSVRRLRGRRGPRDGRRGCAARRPGPRGGASTRRGTMSTIGRGLAQVDGAGGAGEHERSRHEVLGAGPGRVGRVQRALGDGDVSGLRHERGEVAVGDLQAVDPESALRDGVGGCPAIARRRSVDLVHRADDQVEAAREVMGLCAARHARPGGDLAARRRCITELGEGLDRRVEQLGAGRRDALGLRAPLGSSWCGGSSHGREAPGHSVRAISSFMISFVPP
jgi:hypothetical protein